MNKVQEYFAAPGMNQSQLKLLKNSPKLFKTAIKWDSDVKHFRKGSCIDCIITDPERFSEEFIIFNDDLPSGLMGIFLKEFIKAYIDQDLSEESSMEIAYEKSGYKWGKDKVFENFKNNEVYKSYVALKKEHKGKTILPISEYDECVKTAKSIKETSFTKELFEKYEILFQEALYFDYESDHIDLETGQFGHNEKNPKTKSYVVPCKGLMDMILIDHKNKTITGSDLKSTGSPVSQFESSFLKYGYYIQAYYYWHGLQQWKKQHPEYEDYRITDNFIFVVAESIAPHSAIIFDFPNVFLGRDGFTHKGEYYMGTQELINRYCWHRETDQWEAPMEVIVNNGIKTLLLEDE